MLAGDSSGLVFSGNDRQTSFLTGCCSYKWKNEGRVTYTISAPATVAGFQPWVGKLDIDFVPGGTSLFVLSEMDFQTVAADAMSLTPWWVVCPSGSRDVSPDFQLRLSAQVEQLTSLPAVRQADDSVEKVRKTDWVMDLGQVRSDFGL